MSSGVYHCSSQYDYSQPLLLMFLLLKTGTDFRQTADLLFYFMNVYVSPSCYMLFQFGWSGLSTTRRISWTHFLCFVRSPICLFGQECCPLFKGCFYWPSGHVQSMQWRQSEPETTRSMHLKYAFGSSELKKTPKFNGRIYFR